MVDGYVATTGKVVKMAGNSLGNQHDPNSERSRAKGFSGVVGTGAPELPAGLPPDVVREWRNLVELTAGVTYEQDSTALLQLARLIVRNEAVVKLLDSDVANDKLNATQLSIGRQMMALYAKLGLTPRDRQTLIRPKKSDEPKPMSRFDQLRAASAEIAGR